MMTKNRASVVSGSFYPKKPEQILKEMKEFFSKLPKEKKSNCIVAPHAGHIYSGKTAAFSFNALKEAETIIIISPNHSGLGDSISISDADFWETPIGRAHVDTQLRELLLKKLGIEADDLAHIQEHSIEVQLPFIQFLFPKAQILPITLITQNFAELENLANALHSACSGKSVSIVASGDFSHFIPEEKAKKQDLEAIGFIEKMDAKGFHSHVIGNGLSICGVAPITTAILYCKKAGCTKAKLLKYDTSASTTGDKSNVVGYAAIKFE